MKRLNSCLQALQAGRYEENIILNTLEELNKCKTEEISEHRKLIATVYCQLLQYCQDMYETKIPEKFLKKLLNTFESIEQIGTEASEKEKENDAVMLVWFLHELKVYGEIGGSWNIDDEELKKCILMLLQELGRICFIFEIKEDETGQYVFPIHEMIVKVISDQKFFDIKDDSGIYQIHILQLAVKLFKNKEDKQEILDTLVNKCNLKFIEYLQTSASILDTLDLVNYQKNGVMIFFDKLNNKVLIRNKDKNYFLLSSCEDKEELNVEKDYHGNEIGFFTEYKLNSGDSLINYSEMLKQEKGREFFLRLIFEEGMYNILFEDFIIKKQDGNYASINPFCKNDNNIIKGKIKDKYSRVYDKKNILDALSSHRTMALKISNECIMNRVSLGLAILLLQHENVEIDTLGLDTFSEDEWYQSQLLRNWVKKCKDPINSISFILEQWQKENAYCEHNFSNKNRPNIETHEIEPLDFYPLKSKFVWVYENLCIRNPEDCYVLNGRIQENDDEKDSIYVDLKFEVLLKKLREENNISELNIKIEDIEDPDEVLINPYADVSEFYFLHDSKESRNIIYDQKLLKNLSAIITIQKNNQFTLEVAKKISRTQYDEIAKRVLTQKEALKEIGKDVFEDFDTQLYYRLIHNLLWSEINSENIDSYLEIITYHQILDFANITDDEKFMRKDEETLYVPKDGRASESVLTSIYEKYLKTKSCRETNDLFDSEIELSQNRYYHKNKEIKKIMFLCDNIECGTATIRMLKAYLDIAITDEEEGERKRIENAKNRCQKYYRTMGKGKFIEEKISDIINKNLCKIEVHAYYGTKEAKDNIMKFFEEQQIQNASVTYEKEISKPASRIVEKAKNIWKKEKNIRGDIYAVIREFNMTKANVFPDAMLKNPKKAICMFVKKSESKLIKK